ncbi:HIRAN domain-containing protein [Proteiniclasticum sp. C24MP]|uniref:HIRAN domain-containing protein n=1 Tax=Proteiniclasticum sp. C24MP TaxID=3374101 RepID=UPI003753F049
MLINQKRIIVILVLISVFLVACTPKYVLQDEIYSKVAGVTFENEDGVNRQELLSELSSGEELELRLEPENRYDKNAVEIYSSLGKIGYINRELAPYISTLINEDVRVDVVVSEITGGGPSLFYGCNIKISIYDKS